MAAILSRPQCVECIFLKEPSLKFAFKGPINDKSVGLVQVMAWYRTGAKPLSDCEPMKTQFIGSWNVTISIIKLEDG